VDGISLSSDAVIGGDQLLGNSSPLTNDLAVGQSIVRTQVVILPTSLAGNRWFVVTADNGNGVFETDKSNNTSISSQPIGILTPDLTVGSVTAPASAQFGETITVTWTVQNADNAPANVNWSDSLFLSGSSSSVGSALVLLTLPSSDVIPLAPGATYVRTQNVTLPLSRASAPGNYFILAE